MTVADKHKKANETFFEEGLARLRAGEMEESTGKLLMDLMEIRADKALLPFARKWIKLFPRVESAPRLVGKWLQEFESNDAMYMATSYVKTYPDVNALILIIRAVAHLQKIPPKLLDVIEKRFAAEPNSHIWSKLQAPKNPKEELDSLILRWLEINRYNSNVAVDVAWVALFSRSNEVLNEAFRWIEVNQDKTPDIWILFVNMLRGASELHRALAPRVAVTASHWLSRNSDYANAGRIYYDVLVELRNQDEILKAKEWFLEHAETESAQMALAGILRATYLMGEPIEPEFVQSAKKILAAQSPDERAAVLVGSLLELSPDAETIKFAKDTLSDHYHPTWLHAVLLRVAADEQSISAANEIYSKPQDRSPEVIIELLKIDAKNAIARKAAQKWIDKNPNEKQSKELQLLLGV